MNQITDLKLYEKNYKNRADKLNQIALDTAKFVDKELQTAGLKQSHDAVWVLIDWHRRRWLGRFSGCND